MANFFPMNEKGLAVLPIDPIETYKVNIRGICPKDKLFTVNVKF